MKKTVIGSLLLLAITACLPSACTGGCYTITEGVHVNPETACLRLYSGHSPTDPLECGGPSLRGTNECGESLTLPGPAGTGAPIVVAPGGAVNWGFPDSSVAPDVTVTERGSDSRLYSVAALLGARRVTIAVPTHDD